MSSISLVTILAFSFFRPRERKVYAPKVKYRAQDEEDDPPPPISNGFFSWLKPLLSQGDKDLVHTIGASLLCCRAVCRAEAADADRPLPSALQVSTPSPSSSSCRCCAGFS